MKDGKGRLICDGIGTLAEALLPSSRFEKHGQATFVQASTYEGDWSNDLQACRAV